MSDAAILAERAAARTGLDDFGPDGWQEGLEQFVGAARTDLRSTPAAVLRAETTAEARLVNRLRIERWLSEHAAEATHPVAGPVVIVGLPRTATTALHYLLAVDPQFRYPRRWETGEFVPPAVLGEEEHDPRRQAAAAQAADRTVSVQHISSVDGPMEDIAVLGLHFHNQELNFPIPSYHAWWRQADLRSTFAYHERLLRFLHARRPPYRWLIKAPAFLFQLDTIAAQYPQARFLMTHRDPVAALPSTCSTVATAQMMLLPDHAVDADVLGRQLVDHFSEGMQRAMASRDRLGETRFLDVAQHDVQVDPIGTVQRIYEFVGLKLTTRTREAMLQWAARNAKGSRGEHTYTAEDYGLTLRTIRGAFGDYLDRFGAYAT